MMLLESASAAVRPARRGPVDNTSVGVGGLDWQGFYGQLHGYVARRVPNAADQDDLVQLILERALCKQPHDREIDNAAAWLFAIARNAVVDYRRAHGRSRPLAPLDEASAETASSTESEPHSREEVIACMQPLLAILPEEARQLLIWADVDERPLRHIADELGISLTATKSRVQRARKSFVETTQRCCFVTLDGRGRVTALSPKPNGCSPCNSTPTGISRKS